MSAAALETFLARLYTDADLRARFDVDPEGEARGAGLSPAESAALAACDRIGLQMAADSFSRKRAQHRRPGLPLYRRIVNRLLRR
jgi:hypothetical protein